MSEEARRVARLVVEKHVKALAHLQSEGAKQAYLQALIGPPSGDMVTLEFRAQLVSALSRAQLWPHRSSTRETGFE